MSFIEPNKLLDSLKNIADTTTNAQNLGSFDIYQSLYTQIYEEENSLSEENFQKALNGEFETDDVLALSIIEAASQDDDKTTMSKDELDSLIEKVELDSEILDVEQSLNYVMEYLNAGLQKNANLLGEQIISEGVIDNIYNSIKENIGVLSEKYTQEELKTILSATANKYQALNLFMQGDTDNANLALSLALVEEVNGQNTAIGKLQCYIDYFNGDKEKALETFNLLHGESLTKSITQYAMEFGQPIPQGKVCLALDDNNDYCFEIQYENGETEIYCNPATFPENFQIKNFYPMDDDFSTDISIEDFKNAGVVKDIQKIEEMYQAVTGVEFDTKAIKEYMTYETPKTQLDMQLSIAYQLEQVLPDTLGDPFQIFGVLMSASSFNETVAISQFNELYSQIQDSTIKSCKAAFDDNGKIEFLYETNTGTYKIATDKDGDPVLYEESDTDESDQTTWVESNATLEFRFELDGFNRKIANDCVLQNQVYEDFVNSEAYNKFLENNPQLLGENEDLDAKTKTQQFLIYCNSLEKNAFGENVLREAICSYIQDMDTYAQKLTMALQTAAIAGSLAFPLLGLSQLGAIASTSAFWVGYTDNAIDITNTLTNQMPFEQKMEQLKQEGYDLAFETAYKLFARAEGQLFNKAHCLTSGELLRKGFENPDSLWAVFANYPQLANSIGLGVEVALDFGAAYGEAIILSQEPNAFQPILMDILSSMTAAMTGNTTFIDRDGNYYNINANGKNCTVTMAHRNSDGSFSEKQYNIEQGKSYEFKNGEIVPKETSINTAKELNQEMFENLYRNIDAVLQDESSTCAVASVLNAINDKPMLIQAIADKFDYDPTSGNYKFSMFGDDFEVKLNKGDNLLQKVYEAYEIEYGKDIAGDFVYRVFDEMLNNASDIAAKPTSDNMQTLKMYSEDDSSILTFNTQSDIDGISKEHSYTVLEIDDNGNIKLQDPLTQKEITLSKAQYENSDCQIEGKTYLDEGFSDGSTSRMVGTTQVDKIDIDAAQSINKRSSAILLGLVDRNVMQVTQDELDAINQIVTDSTISATEGQIATLIVSGANNGLTKSNQLTEFVKAKLDSNTGSIPDDVLALGITHGYSCANDLSGFANKYAAIEQGINPTKRNPQYIALAIELGCNNITDYRGLYMGSQGFKPIYEAYIDYDGSNFVNKFNVWKNKYTDPNASNLILNSADAPTLSEYLHPDFTYTLPTNTTGDRMTQALCTSVGINPINGGHLSSAYSQPGWVHYLNSSTRNFDDLGFGTFRMTYQVGDDAIDTNNSVAGKTYLVTRGSGTAAQGQVKTVLDSGYYDTYIAPILEEGVKLSIGTDECGYFKINGILIKAVKSIGSENFDHFFYTNQTTGLPERIINYISP